MVCRSGWIMSAPWMLERYAEAREHFKVRKPKAPEGSSDVIVRENRMS